MGHVWLVEPAARTIEVFRREAGRWVLAGQHAGETTTRIEPFEDGDVDLAQIWPLLTTP